MMMILWIAGVHTFDDDDDVFCSSFLMIMIMMMMTFDHYYHHLIYPLLFYSVYFFIFRFVLSDFVVLYYVYSRQWSKKNMTSKWKTFCPRRKKNEKTKNVRNKLEPEEEKNASARHFTRLHRHKKEKKESFSINVDDRQQTFRLQPALTLLEIRSDQIFFLLTIWPRWP